MARKQKSVPKEKQGRDSLHALKRVFLYTVVFLAGVHVERLDLTLHRMTQHIDNVQNQEDLNENSINRRKPSGLTSLPEYQLASDQSFGFFDDVTDEDWILHTAWARNQGNHRYITNPFRQWQKPALWYYNNFNPIFSCPHVKRISGIGDGPKWVCDPHRIARQVERRQKDEAWRGPPCIIYSIGSNGNYEFEDGLFHYLGPICEIHVFDFSNNYDRPENKERNIHFHQLGLQGTSQDRSNKGNFASFPEILKQLGHEGRPIDIFKIDCEGCEWDTHKDWIDYDLRQVLIETHGLPGDQQQGMDFFNSFRTNNLIMYSKEVNGFGGGIFYEFSYVKLHPDFLGQNNTTANV